MAAIAWVMVWIIVGAHFLWAAIVLGGSLLAVTGGLLRRPRVELVYLTTIFLTLLSVLLFKGCILTQLELQLRAISGLPIYAGGFVAHALSVLFGQPLNEVFIGNAAWIALWTGAGIGLTATVIRHLLNLESKHGRYYLISAIVLLILGAFTYLYVLKADTAYTFSGIVVERNEAVVTLARPTNGALDLHVTSSTKLRLVREDGAYAPATIDQIEPRSFAIITGRWLLKPDLDILTIDFQLPKKDLQ